MSYRVGWEEGLEFDLELKMTASICYYKQPPSCIYTSKNCHGSWVGETLSQGWLKTKHEASLCFDNTWMDIDPGKQFQVSLGQAKQNRKNNSNSLCNNDYYKTT